MNGHCGITGSTYRPIERATYVRRMEAEPIDPLAAARWLVLSITFNFAVVLGIVAGIAFGRWL
jgi:hypothetical protein